MSDARLTLNAEVQNGRSSAAFFSVREMERKLKHTFRSRGKESKRLPKLTTSTKHTHSRSVFGHDCIYNGVETENPSTYTVPKKIDFSSDSFSFCNEHEVDVSPSGRCNLQKQWRLLSSFEIDSCLSPGRESHYIGSAQVSLSPCRLSKQRSSSFVPSTDEEEEEEEEEAAQEVVISPTPNMNFNEPGDIRHSERAAKIELDKDEYGGVMDSIMVSAASSLLSDSTRYQEERQSLISVLDQFLSEDSASPSNAAFQSGKKQYQHIGLIEFQKLTLLGPSAARGPLKPRCLHFEEHEPLSSSSSQDYTISNYLRLIFKASSLNWDQLSALRPSPKHLLHPSLFDQAQFLMFDSPFETRLLFDHVNEVLLKTKRTHFISPYLPASAKPKICSLPLEEAVVDEIMREAEFYLLLRTQSRTLDQLLAIDFSSSRSRPDFQAESEQLIVHISEDILEDSVLDVVLQLYS